MRNKRVPNKQFALRTWAVVAGLGIGQVALIFKPVEFCQGRPPADPEDASRAPRP